MEPGLLPGEPVDADDPMEVEHWLRVYAELVHTTTQIAASAPSPSLTEQLLHLMARLNLWQSRAVGLVVEEAAE